MSDQGLREATDALLEALERVNYDGQVGDVEDLDAAREVARQALASTPSQPDEAESEIITAKLPVELVRDFLPRPSAHRKMTGAEASSELSRILTAALKERSDD